MDKEKQANEKLAFVIQDITKHNFGPFTGEFTSDGAPYSAARPGHDGNFVFQYPGQSKALPTRLIGALRNGHVIRRCGFMAAIAAIDGNFGAVDVRCSIRRQEYCQMRHIIGHTPAW